MTVNQTTPQQHLIPIRDIEEEWDIVNKARGGKTWRSDDVGAVVQTVPVGKEQLGSGTMLVAKAPLNEAIDGLRCVVELRKGHRAGIVFNYIDDKNHALCVVEDLRRRHGGDDEPPSSRNQVHRGYTVTLAHKSNGRVEVVASHTIETVLPKRMTLEIRNTDGGLVLNANGQPLGGWADHDIEPELRAGLYSEKSSRTRFVALNVLLAAAEEPVPEPGPEPDPGGGGSSGQPPASGNNGSNDSPQPPSPDPRPPFPAAKPAAEQSELGRMMSLSKPKGKTTLEFTEVSTVPLDAFYGSLYLNSAYEPQLPGAKVPRAKAHVQTIDFRPKRWYRDYQQVLDELGFVGIDIHQLRNVISTAADSTSDVDTVRADYLAKLEVRNRLKDWQQEVLRDITTSGYTLQDQNTPQVIEDQGYTFHILGRERDLSQFEELEVPDGVNLGDDAEWRRLEGLLRDRLTNPAVVSKDTKHRYETQVASLANLEASPLAAKVASIERDISSQFAQRNALDGEASAMASALHEWTDDRNELVLRRYDFHRLDTDNFPAFVPAPTGMILGMPGIAVGGSHHSGFIPLFNLSIGMLRPLGVQNNANFYGWVYELPPSGTPLKHPLCREYDDLFRQRVNTLGTTGVHWGGRRRLRRLEIDFSTRLAQGEWRYDKSITYGTCVGLRYDELPTTEFFHYFDVNAQYVQDQPTGTLRGWAMEYAFRGSQDILEFFRVAVAICDHFVDKLQAAGEALAFRRAEIDQKIAVHNAALQDIQDNGLRQLRNEFIAYWNNPDTNGAAPATTDIVFPDRDQLAEFLRTLADEAESSKPPKTYFLSFKSDGFYTQDGQSLVEFIKLQETRPEDAVAVLPVLDKNGHISDEVLTAIRNPRISNKRAELPVIRFVETYEMEVSWTGYGLGELSHSFNLFPGETKELVIEKATKQTTKLSTTKSQEEIRVAKASSSFEDRLDDTFSTNTKLAQSAEGTSKSSRQKSSSYSHATTESDSLSANASLSIPVLGGLFGGGINSNSSSSSSTNRSRALAISQSLENKRASNQSEDILKKVVNNAVSKTASETSSENKLQVSTQSSEELTESTNEKETIRIENPNIGRTVNYNFFQLQNHYEISVHLTDVKIVVNTGVEVIAESGMTDIRVYEVEEFAKIFSDLDENDPRSALLAAIVTRQVLKHYAHQKLAPGVAKGNGAVTVPEGAIIDAGSLATLAFALAADESDAGAATGDALVQQIRAALAHLKGAPFVFSRTTLLDKSTYAVNAGAYHLEAQVGKMAATEAYLEERRDIETNRQRAQVKHLEEQTRQAVFFPDLPDSLTSLEGAIAVSAPPTSRGAE
jgi:hypothetical protein